MANELMTKEETALVESAFDSYQGQTGFEGVSNDDISFPFLRIAQPLSPQCDKQSEARIEGLEPGDFFNTVTAKRYGPTVRLIIVGYFRSFVEWEGDGKNAKFKGQITALELEKIRGGLTQDGSKLYTKTGTYYQDTRNFLVLNADALDDGEMLFSLKSTGIPHSKKWISLARNQHTIKGGIIPIFGCIWEVKTAYNSNDKGSYYAIGKDKNTLIKRDGLIPADILDQVRVRSEQFGKEDITRVKLTEETDTIEGDEF